jgi:hypothetical protein
MEHVIEENQKLRKWLIGILTALVVILIFLILLVIHDYRRARTVDQAQTTQSALSAERKTTGPLSKVEVGDITGWMTFDYVNYLFNLPPAYLKSAGPVNSSLYPHLSLNSFARHSNQSRSAVVTEIQNAVTAYLSASSTTQ